MSRPLRPLAVACAAAIAISPIPGCALFSRPAGDDVRWFTPELSTAPAGRAEAQPDAPALPLQLGPVTAGAGIKLRIAYSNGLYDVGYYEERRWTERPALYVRRALERALFDEGRFRPARGDDAPVLDVNVFEFEQVQGPTSHAARIALRLTLSTDAGLVERTIRVSQPAQDSSFDAFVAAMVLALRESAGDVARTVSGALQERAP